MLNEKNMSVSPKEGEETVIPAEFIITLEIALICSLNFVPGRITRINIVFI